MTQSKKILIIDDDPHCLQLYGFAIEKAGYQVTLADKKSKIIREIETGTFDLLLIDLILPDIDVSELIEKFHKINRNAKVILITGYPELMSSIEYLLESHIYEYLTKPISPNKIIQTVNEALNEQGK